MKGSSVPVKVYVPTSISKPVVTNNEMQINEPLDSAQVPEASAPGGNDGSPESSLAGEEGKKLCFVCLSTLSDL